MFVLTAQVKRKILGYNCVHDKDFEKKKIVKIQKE